MIITVPVIQNFEEHLDYGEKLKAKPEQINTKNIMYTRACDEVYGITEVIDEHERILYAAVNYKDWRGFVCPSQVIWTKSTI